MAEDIKFVRNWFAEVETIPGRMRQVAFRAGTRLRAEVCPVGRGEGTEELADLRLADGTTARSIPLVRFVVVQKQARAA